MARYNDSQARRGNERSEKLTIRHLQIYFSRVDRWVIHSNFLVESLIMRKLATLKRQKRRLMRLQSCWRASVRFSCSRGALSPLRSSRLDPRAKRSFTRGYRD